jgi:predicted TIM-barrel fold metal-dependent hydrolase
VSKLFEVTEQDVFFYHENIKDFLPKEIIDVHTHVWLNKFIERDGLKQSRSVSWPSLVAKDNSIEDLYETYRLLFPDKIVTPIIFSHPNTNLNIDAGNKYIEECSNKYNLPALLLSNPSWNEEDFEKRLKNFLGAKVYLNYAPSYIPADEIRIFDFAPPHHLAVLNRLNKVLMLHIPRSKRLKDPVNLAQMLEIEDKFPNIKLIIAHVGRAYCDEDMGNAFKVLKNTKNMMFDFSANTNSTVFEKTIETFGPKRILFGSDMPILRMRSRRITENGRYINLVPKGLYGDISKDKNMRDTTDPNITFFMYEEINAFKKAAVKCSLKACEIEDIFKNNALKIIKEASK